MCIGADDPETVKQKVLFPPKADPPSEDKKQNSNQGEIHDPLPEEPDRTSVRVPDVSELQGQHEMEGVGAPLLLALRRMAMVSEGN
ncbi:MAG: hypothetical protein G01um101419_36 [Parcubacteria group bacterium Gr01-1014_19]|nr:MAG: hypothetical protein G01um101419_36 [Parcubacteria group bacterium Gr01-1014_19]